MSISMQNLYPSTDTPTLTVFGYFAPLSEVVSSSKG